MLRFFLLTCLALGACAPHQDITATTDSWTRFSRVIAPEHEVFRDAKAIMTVRPVIIARDGQRAYGVLTNIRRRVPNGPLINAMYSGDIKLDYQRHDRLLTHCIDGCQRAEIGIINMTEDSFRLAARVGLPMRVFGRRGRYMGTVEALHFQQVLDAARDQRPD